MGDSRMKEQGWVGPGAGRSGADLAAGPGAVCCPVVTKLSLAAGSESVYCVRVGTPATTGCGPGLPWPLPAEPVVAGVATIPWRRSHVADVAQEARARAGDDDPASAAPAPLEVRRRFQLPTAFESLHHRNYRLLWIGSLISSSGDWMDQVALNWLVYELTGSAFSLGLLNLCRLVPILVFTLICGGGGRPPRRGPAPFLYPT